MSAINVRLTRAPESAARPPKAASLSKLSPWLFAITTALATTSTAAQVAPVSVPSEVVPTELTPVPATNLKAPSQSGSAAPPKDPPRIPIRAYGFFWASIFATQPVQSFGFPTAVAPTSAINPALSRNPNDVILSYQVQQTRAGIAVGEGTPFKGTLEIDFVHFEQSTPVAQAYPRIRIGLLEWTYKPNQKFFMGQTWDIFGNGTGPQLLSHSYNIVGTLFQAGNIGFLRQQLGWAGRFGDLEISFAAGLQGSNVGAAFNNVELSAAPTGAARVMYFLPANLGVVGVSGIGTSLRFTNKDNDVRHRGAGGGHMFADLTFGTLNLHGELYVAQNIANTGSLNLSQGRYESDMADAGGYLSGKISLGQHAITAMYGYASVLRPSKVVAGYSPAVAAGPMSAAVGASSNASFGPGIDHNMTGHLGYGYSPINGLTIFLEPYVYATKYKLASSDVGKVANSNTSWGIQGGSMYVF